MDLTLQPVVLATHQDSEGQLVFVDDRLVAILVRLSAMHGEQSGWWFVENGYGAIDGARHPSFRDLASALAWIKASLEDRPPSWP